MSLHSGMLCAIANGGRSKMTQLDRIEKKVDALTHMMATLIEALAEDDMDESPIDLNGHTYGGTRDDTQAL